MDLQKTAELICQRRKELGLTQKMLADKLSISDRTVSKWERAAGFPDVSLIEPLADELGLTVMELFRGQKEPTAPEEESSAREVLNYCLPQMEQSSRRARKWITFLSLILIFILVSLPFLVRHSHSKWFSSQPISAEAAVHIAPEILISTADYDFLRFILSDESIQEAYSNYNSEPLYLDGDAVSKFRTMVTVDGEAPLFFDISVHWDEITIKYGSQHTFIALKIYDEDISKHVIRCEYPYLTADGKNIPMGQRHGNRIDLDNYNNTEFHIAGYKTGWLEMFRTTYY